MVPLHWVLVVPVMNHKKKLMEKRIEMNIKKPYQRPRLIKFSEKQDGQGLCYETGSGDSGECNGNGSSAGTTCTWNGNDAEGACDFGHVYL